MRTLAEKTEQGADEVDDDRPEDGEGAANGDGSLDDYASGRRFRIRCAVARAEIAACGDAITPFT